MSADLPDRVRVKISSEAAGEISITPVIAQEIPLPDLVQIIVGQCGKDAVRLRELLLRGTVVQSASRFRWSPVDVDLERARAMLERFPDPDPSIAFDPQRCIRVAFCDLRSRLELPEEIMRGRRFLRRRSFWDGVMAEAKTAALAYSGYSYRERADLFQFPVNADAAQRIRQAAALLRYSGLRAQVERLELTYLELAASRAGLLGNSRGTR